MSNHFAIATVTAALKEIVQRAIIASNDLGGGGTPPTVTTFRPSSKDNVTKRGVNIFLHQVTPNAAWRNADVPTRRSGGQVVARPVLALDLHYVLTFYGEESKWEPQRFLAIAMRTLHARPILSPELVDKVVAAYAQSTEFDFLKKSDLARSLEPVRITPASVSLDELSKLWSSFYQTDYALSAVYVASPVLIEAEETPQEALPVRAPSVSSVPFAAPEIERVRPLEGRAIVARSKIVVHGTHLLGQETRLLVDDEPHVGTLELGDTQVAATLPASLAAGLHSVQIAHLVALGEPPTLRRGIESNAAAFLLHPVVTTATVGTTTGQTVGGTTLVSGTLKLVVEPLVGRDQRLSLLLNPTEVSGEPPAYVFAIPPRVTEPSSTDPLELEFGQVRPGTYRVRLQVAGASSVPAGSDYPTVIIS